MKTHTQTFKNNIKEMGRELDSKITYSINNEEIELGNSELNSVIPIVESSILKSVMKELDIDSNVNIPLGTIINYKLGIKLNESDYEYLNFGNYIVYSSEKQEDTNSYNIVCFDKMLYSMIPYKKVNPTNQTLRAYINAICNELGITFANAGDSFVNSTQIINADLYIGVDGADIGYTFRDVLDEIAQVTASTIIINENDELEIRYINDTNDTIDESYLKDTNVNFGEKYGPINSIVLSRAAESDNVYLRDEQSVEDNGLCEIKIKDNQIMNFNDRSEFLPEILQKLNGLEYYTNDFNSTGICYYDVCDRYNIKIGDQIYSCIMFNDEIKVSQGLEEIIFTDLPEVSETDYKKSDTTDRRINQTYLIVDKQNNIIQGVVSNQKQIEKELIIAKTTTADEIEDAGPYPLQSIEIEGASTHPTPPKNPTKPTKIDTIKGKTNYFDINTIIKDKKLDEDDGVTEIEQTGYGVTSYIRVQKSGNYYFKCDDSNMVTTIFVYDSNREYEDVVTSSSAINLTSGTYIRLQAELSFFESNYMLISENDFPLGNIDYYMPFGNWLAQKTENIDDEVHYSLIDMNKPNLFDDSLEVGNISSINGNNLNSDNSVRNKNYIKVKPNSIYSIEFDKNVGHIVVFRYNSNKSYTFSDYADSNYNENISKFIFTTNSETEYIRFTLYSTDISNSIKIYEGSEPYYEFTELNNKKDVFSDGKLLKENEKLVLTDNERWTENNIHKGLFKPTKDYFYPLDDAENCVLFSNGFKCISKDEMIANINNNLSTDLVIGPGEDNKLCVVYKKYANNINGFETFLKELYDKGTPICVYYNRNKPQNYELKYEPLLLFEGYNLLSFDTNIIGKVTRKYLTISILNATYLTKSQFEIENNRITQDINSKISSEEFEEVIIEQNNNFTQQITESENSTKSELTVTINNAANTAIATSKDYTDVKLYDYPTTIIMNNTIEQKINESENSIKLEVSNNYVNNDEYTSAQILLKINNDTSSAVIKADKLDLTGLVTISNLQNAGETIINGSNITTGTIDASLVNVSNINADNIKTGVLEGIEIKAETGEIGHWTIFESGISKTTADGAYSVGMICSNSSDGVAFHVYSRDLARNIYQVTNNGNLYCENVNIKGEITATSGYIGTWRIDNNGYLRGMDFNGNYLIISPNYVSMTNSSGDVALSSWINIINNSSDERLKDNITLIEEKYENFFNDLKPKTFNYNNIFNIDDKKHFGFVAQDILDSAEKNEIEDLYLVYKNGDYYNLDKQEIIALNTWQIQKLKKDIGLLKEKVEELESR